ncbi:MAG: trypsin-like peptidase domain-containing protein [Candidatus Faecousia sp.]|nr:trypsin-like peptidase domain-containing protein [Candidatus Faecousia sp.]
MENNDNDFGFYDSQESQHTDRQNLEPMNHPEQSSAPSGKKGRKGMRAAVSAVLVMALVAGSCGATYGILNSKFEKQAQADAAAIQQLQQRLSRQSTQADPVGYVMEEGALSPKQIYQEYASSVVAISSTVETLSYGGQTRQGTYTGSGFILTDDGYVVTNYHVIEGATSVTVVMDTQEEYPAEVIGYDALNDVAVLKIDAKNLPAVKLGSSDALSIGDMVVAIGNPLGSLTATLTVGYVSGKDRQVSTDSTVINMIQTDAAINSGNSGGPLFNVYGEVVGITSAKYSGTTTSGASIEGIGFAIPIDDVMSIIGDLRDFGYVTGAYLGVTVQDTDASAASLYGLPTGAYVVTVVEDGSADQAGIQPKDIIIKLGDTDVSTVSELTRALRRFKAGDQTTVTVIRSGERITLDEKPKDLDSGSNVTATEPNMPDNGSYDEWYKYFFGENRKG